MSALLVALAALAMTPDQVTSPRAAGAWVSDMAGVLDDDVEARLNATIESLHGDLGVEIAVVMLQDVDGTPKAFATELFNTWGIGDSQANNGLLILMVMGQRRLEMETGYGLEPILPDGWLGRMQADRMVPRFKQGDFGAGIEAGLDAVAERLRKNPDAAREGASGADFVPAGGPDAYDEDTGGGAGWWVAGGGTGGTGGLLFLAGWRRRRKRIHCEVCDVDRTELDEDADDEHLDAGQIAEERVGSVDYVVYCCPVCSSTDVLARKKWFSGFGRCPECRYRTKRVTSQTLSAATTSSSGSARVTEDCKHCSYHKTYTRTIPRIADTSSSSSSSSSYSSSSSSGGSFGGGSSGGGGAGSSW